jgi:hypothetical protein
MATYALVLTGILLFFLYYSKFVTICHYHAMAIFILEQMGGGGGGEAWGSITV